MHDFLDVLAKRGALLDPAAAAYLSRLENPVAHYERIAENVSPAGLVVTLEEIQLAERFAREAAMRAVVTPPAHPEPALAPAPELALPPVRAVARDVGPAADFADSLQVLRDVTGRSTCHGTVEDFTRVFRHRLQTLRGILRQRREFSQGLTIAQAKQRTREVAFVGIVSDMGTTRNGHRRLVLEDETGTVPVIVPNSVPAFQETVLTDEVLGVVARATEKEYLIAEALFRPDVPNGNRPVRTIGENFLVGFLSDVHVGSKTFLAEPWERFVAWTNDGDEAAKALKYLVVSGDVVDGIGVYPRQDQELAVDDIYAQYEELARRLHGLPDHLRVIMLPGNHDAVRPAEPQPTFPEAVRKLFDSNVTFVGNPCLFTLHGLRVLAYHGRSMDDWVSRLPGASYHRPLEVMKEMLLRRHLAPVYGGKTPIAPEAEDYLAIPEVPDIFATGHVHGVGVEAYRGIHLVNSSTWQAQTAFQKMHNIQPEPARLPLINVHTGRATIKEF